MAEFKLPPGCRAAACASRLQIYIVGSRLDADWQDLERSLSAAGNA
jgi:hypothetical protein